MGAEGMKSRQTTWKYVAVRPVQGLSTTAVSTLALHSPNVRREEVDRAANGDDKVDGYANESQPDVEANAGVYLPAFLNLLPLEEQEPGHDGEHAQPDEHLGKEEGELDEIIVALGNKEAPKP